MAQRWEGLTSYGYKAYVPWPWPDGARQLVLSHDVAAAVSEAERSLKSLAGHPGLNPALWLLDRAESLGSSTMEGIRPSARRVAVADEMERAASEPLSEDDRRMLSNIRITQEAISMATAGSGMSTKSVCALNRLLLGPAEGAGRIRDDQNWVDAKRLSDGPRHAVYVPPPAPHVPGLMDDVIQMLNASGHSPIVTAALAHAQLESVHPFAAGNGRVGRALIQYVLCRSGLLRGGPLPVSAALALRKGEYSDALNETRIECAQTDYYSRSQALSAWVRMLSAAVVEAVDYRKRIEDRIGAIERRWDAALKDAATRRDATVHRVFPLLFLRPVATAASLV